eukprot:TRINITY_DN23474_c0_g1_i1.p1 TRINITY_DN23474_c0_g1~~TRINITY_DN23474_c0_g1_i1.p1  ORF type:complete len:406 (-),score=72.22 TRINITY_DN23474_c0_g1_i1:33-1250(-)
MTVLVATFLPATLVCLLGSGPDQASGVFLGGETVAGSPLVLGRPREPLGAELERDHPARRSWSMKNESLLMDFVRVRSSFVEDENVFDSFRRTVDAVRGGAGGVDGAYTKIPEDSGRMLGILETCSYGTALLGAVLPRIVGRIDGFGSPATFQLARHGQVSPDLFHGVFKLGQILRSFDAFAPVPGGPAPPTAGDVWAGPELSRLFQDWDIVEVGAGPGLHAATLVAAFGAKSYSIADLPTQQVLQHKVLRRALGPVVDKTFAFVPFGLDEIDPSYVLKSYSLFLSTYAFSELNVEVRRLYFHTFVVRSRRGFIIDNHQDLPHMRPGGAKDRGEYVGLDLVHRLLDHGFDVRIRTYQEHIGVPVHRSRAVLITWAALNAGDGGEPGRRRAASAAAARGDAGAARR